MWKYCDLKELCKAGQILESFMREINCVYKMTLPTRYV